MLSNLSSDLQIKFYIQFASVAIIHQFLQIKIKLCFLQFSTQFFSFSSSWQNSILCTNISSITKHKKNSIIILILSELAGTLGYCSETKGTNLPHSWYPFITKYEVLEICLERISERNKKKTTSRKQFSG